MNRFFFIIMFTLLGIATACEKKADDVCQSQEVSLKNYLCFRPSEGLYVLQSQSDLMAFIDSTACLTCDCMPVSFEINFGSQTALAFYTVNCGNDSLNVCRNDAEESVVYTITQSTNQCLAAIENYNLVTVPKFPSNYTTTVVIE